MIKKKRTTINLGRYYVDDELSVRFTPSVIDRILEVAAIVIGLVAFGFAYYLCYKTEEDFILKWMFPLVIPLSVFLLYRSGYASPQKISFPVRITKQNLGIQYLLAVRLVRVLNILLTTMMLFAALTLLFDNEKMAFLNVVFIILIIGSLITHYILAYLHR
ncbi:MAG: hypothetical protein IIW32_05040 [Bacteroides sp.]|nr:hypothetical protein [Bacteroides sp.]